MPTKKKPAARPTNRSAAAAAGKTVPVIRTAVATGETRMTFRVTGGYRLDLPEGKGRIQRVTKKRIWRVQRQESVSARFAFALLVGEFKLEEEAQQLVQELDENGFSARIQTLGRELQLGKFTHDNRCHQVIVGYCESTGEVEELQQELEQYEPVVFRERIEEPAGRFEIFDLEYDRHTMVDNVARLIPETPECRLTLLKTKVYAGNSRVEREDLEFRGIVEFRVENGGLMLAINEVELDDYVLAVLAAEQDGDYPREALKAKAIAVRSLALAELGQQHPWDDYDFCALDHCQRYRGITTIDDLQEKAVSMTRGRVMLHEGRVAYTWYSPVCGGHLEVGENVFQTPQAGYLRALPDKTASTRTRKRVDLTVETNARVFIKSEPKTLCNVTQRDSQQVYEQSRRFYRWQETYQRRELEEVITRSTGVEIGTLYEIIPIKRGTSGRILELEIIGSRNNVLVTGEAEIRRTLSSSTLLSSCFYIEVEYGDLNEPLNFVVNGAGHGHGVGMCETGAGTLAVAHGAKFKEILEHYYHGIEVKKIYS